MIKFNGEPKKLIPGMTVQQLFNFLGQQGQVSDYNWFVNEQQVQLTADHKVTTMIKINSNLRLEPKQQPFQQPPLQINLAPSTQKLSSEGIPQQLLLSTAFNLNPPQSFNPAPPQALQPQPFKVAPPQQTQFRVAPQQSQEQTIINAASPQKQPQTNQNVSPLFFNTSPQQQNVNVLPLQSLSQSQTISENSKRQIMKQLARNSGPIPRIQTLNPAVERIKVQKTGNYSTEGEIKNFSLYILDYGDQVIVSKKDKSMKITLYESDSNPEITQCLLSTLLPDDICQDDNNCLNFQDTKVFLLRNQNGVIVKWRTNMISKFEFWCDE